MGMKYIACSKLIPTETKNDRQIPVTTYTEVEIQGYRGSGSNTIVQVAGKSTVETIYKFFCNDFSILQGDLIQYEGETYEIMGQPRNTANRNHHIKTSIRKIDNVKQQ